MRPTKMLCSSDTTVQIFPIYSNFIVSFFPFGRGLDSAERNLVAQVCHREPGVPLATSDAMLPSHQQPHQALLARARAILAYETGHSHNWHMEASLMAVNDIH